MYEQQYNLESILPFWYNNILGAQNNRNSGHGQFGHIILMAYAPEVTLFNKKFKGTCSFIYQGTSTRSEWSDLFGLLVKLPPVTTSLATRKYRQSLKGQSELCSFSHYPFNTKRQAGNNVKLGRIKLPLRSFV